MPHRAICIQALIFEVDADTSVIFSLLIFICLVISLGPLRWIMNVKKIILFNFYVQYQLC